MSRKKQPVIIIGGGLAGCEAAWQLTRRGHVVELYEMKPQKFSPAHKMEGLAELVCSNSLKSNSLDNAHGLLKEELRCLDSLIMMAADSNAVAAGIALAVDRLQFSQYIEQHLNRQIDFHLTRREITAVPNNSLTIVATGPLTSEPLAQSMAKILGSSSLYFYDAIAPIVEADSINMDKVYWASRYDKGTPDYLNCPLTQEEYVRLRQELLAGEKVPLKPFEEKRHFEGCLPIEILAERGENTMAFGPLKPVGLINPKTKTMPYGVVQLRRENSAGTLFNMVGFQTKLTWPEQQRIFRLIPGLENARFARFGSIHRNTYIHSPSLLTSALRLKTDENIFFSGQITGVEGYMESAATGLWTGLYIAKMLEGKELLPPPQTTALGALLQYVTSPEHAENFQPMNINFGLLETLPERRIKKKERNLAYVKRALQDLQNWIINQGLNVV